MKPESAEEKSGMNFSPSTLDVNQLHALIKDTCVFHGFDVLKFTFNSLVHVGGAFLL